jgi:hypothetical protein
MRFAVGAIEYRSFENPVEGFPAVITYSEADRISIGHSRACIPAGVKKIFGGSAIDNPGGHCSTVVKTSKLTQAKDWLIMNIRNVAQVVGVHFDKSGNGSIPIISGSKIDSQKVVIDPIDKRDLSMTGHPVVISLRGKYKTFLLPIHGRTEALEIQVFA